MAVKHDIVVNFSSANDSYYSACSFEPKKSKCLSNLDFHEFLLTKKMKQKEELFAVVQVWRRYEEGKKDLASFPIAPTA